MLTKREIGRIASLSKELLELVEKDEGELSPVYGEACGSHHPTDVDATQEGFVGVLRNMRTVT